MLAKTMMPTRQRCCSSLLGSPAPSHLLRPGPASPKTFRSSSIHRTSTPRAPPTSISWNNSASGPSVEEAQCAPRNYHAQLQPYSWHHVQIHRSTATPTYSDTAKGFWTSTFSVSEAFKAFTADLVVPKMPTLKRLAKTTV